MICMNNKGDHSAETTKDWVFSIEFFPPKTDELRETFKETAREASELDLDFASITYGAGGKSRDLTWDFANWLQTEGEFTVMPHLTCVGQDQDEIGDLMEQYSDRGFEHILALRGDTPKGETSFPIMKNGFRYATELVSFIRERHPEMEIGVAGYPEKHPEAPDLQKDLLRLKEKVDAGADFIVTQLFFDNEDFKRFREGCQAVGVDIPIHAGLMPPVNLKQLEKFCGFCGAHIPEVLRERLQSANGSKEAEFEIGMEWTTAQLEALMEDQVEGIHFYPLNRPKIIQGLCEYMGHIPGFLKEPESLTA